MTPVLVHVFKSSVSTRPFVSVRLSKLLLRLPALRLISAAVTEELFFAGLIGNVQIDSIIPYILKMESTDYNSQTSAGVWDAVPLFWLHYWTVKTPQPSNRSASQSDHYVVMTLLYLWCSILWEFGFPALILALVLTPQWPVCRADSSTMDTWYKHHAFSGIDPWNLHSRLHPYCI